MFHRKVKPPPDALIIKRRRHEDRLARIQGAVKEDAKLGAVAAWEARTEERIRSLESSKGAAAVREAAANALDERRARLAAKLAAEDAMLQAELEASKVTPEQRRAELAARARQMAERREAERSQLAAELAEAAFREGCDPLRERVSRQLVARIAVERKAQVEAKQLALQREAQERSADAALHEAAHARMERRHCDDMRRRQESTSAVKQSLDQQIAAKRERQDAEAQQAAKEAAALRDEWARLQAEAEAAEAADRERERQLADEVRAYNKLRLLQLSKVENEERQADLALLNAALAREAQEEAADAAAREERHQAVRHYRQQLALMMAKEQADRGEQEACVQAALRDQLARQDADWESRAQARRRLMDEVAEIRGQQVAAKEAARRQAKAEQRLELAALQEQEALAAVNAREAVEHARRCALRSHLDIQAQVAARERIRAAEIEEKHRAAEVAAQSEAGYLARVAAAEAAVAPQPRFGRKKVEWYHP